MKTKKCPVCGKSFEPSIFNPNYCSDECKKKKLEQEKPFINPINLAPKQWNTEYTKW